MSITVTGTVYGDPQVYVNRAGDITINLDILLQEKDHPNNNRGLGHEYLIHVIVVSDPLIERVSQDIGKDAQVTITAHRIEVEGWHDAGPKAVVVADDIKAMPAGGN